MAFFMKTRVRHCVNNGRRVCSLDQRPLFLANYNSVRNRRAFSSGTSGPYRDFRGTFQQDYSRYLRRGSFHRPIDAFPSICTEIRDIAPSGSCLIRNFDDIVKDSHARTCPIRFDLSKDLNLHSKPCIFAALLPRSFRLGA